MTILDYFKSEKLQFIHCHSEVGVSNIYNYWIASGYSLSEGNKNFLARVNPRTLNDIYVYADTSSFVLFTKNNIKDIESFYAKRFKKCGRKKELLGMLFYVIKTPTQQYCFPLLKTDVFGTKQRIIAYDLIC